MASDREPAARRLPKPAGAPPAEPSPLRKRPSRAQALAAAEERRQREAEFMQRLRVQMRDDEDDEQ